MTADWPLILLFMLSASGRAQTQTDCQDQLKRLCDPAQKMPGKNCIMEVELPLECRGQIERTPPDVKTGIESCRKEAAALCGGASDQEQFQRCVGAKRISFSAACKMALSQGIEIPLPPALRKKPKLKPRSQSLQEACAAEIAESCADSKGEEKTRKCLASQASLTAQCRAALKPKASDEDAGRRE